MNIVINNRIKDIERALDRTGSLSIMGIPGGGISVLLKELSKSTLGYPIYIDVFALPDLSGQALIQAIASALKTDTSAGDHFQAILQKLQELTSDGPVVIYFAGFDQLANALNSELLQALQTITRTNNQVKMVFGLCISLKKLIPDAHFDSGLRVFGNKYYMGIYSPDELRYLLTMYGPENYESHPELEPYIDLC